MSLRETIAAELDATRRRSLTLLDPLPEDDQTRQHSKLMSPLVWDLAHVGNYEEIWLLRDIGFTGVRPEIDGIYNAFLTPRDERTRLPMLGPSEARGYITDVRGRVLDGLERVDLDAEERKLREGFLYGMVVQHEHMHDESMLATLQLMDGDGYAPYHEPVLAPAGGLVAPPEVLIDAGTFVMGTDDEPWAYDNERSAHERALAPFWIDTTPVTNGAYLGFIEAGGYDDPRLWTEEGWAWRQKADLRAPQFWERSPEGWGVLRFGRREPLLLDEPVQHVCFHEADAYARWAGKRLPAEAEWEAAASWDPVARAKRRFPWGNDEPTLKHANLSQRQWGPSPVGAYPDGATPSGVHQMLGDVWEWTSSDFQPYPGFLSFPYAEYSEVFYGAGYKVLRGGSWATAPVAIRNTFRNWDYPIRRQIFCGFRCARDA
ncbi:MAG TPA: ergothioneine biosynthesis protein EgtB [Actinomycetota bacterium]